MWFAAIAAVAILVGAGLAVRARKRRKKGANEIYPFF